jgi:hypothetical protein
MAGAENVAGRAFAVDSRPARNGGGRVPRTHFRTKIRLARARQLNSFASPE